MPVTPLWLVLLLLLVQAAYRYVKAPATPRPQFPSSAQHLSKTPAARVFTRLQYAVVWPGASLFLLGMAAMWLLLWQYGDGASDASRAFRDQILVLSLCGLPLAVLIGLEFHWGNRSARVELGLSASELMLQLPGDTELRHYRGQEIWFNRRHLLCGEQLLRRSVGPCPRFSAHDRQERLEPWLQAHALELNHAKMFLRLLRQCHLQTLNSIGLVLCAVAFWLLLR